MPQLVIASQNPHKLLELRYLLKPFPQWDLLTHGVVEAELDDQGFLAEAEAKALLGAQETGQLTLADSSGLVVPALEEAQRTEQRVTCQGITDADTCRDLILRMEPLYNERRAAYMVCALALAEPGRLLRSVHSRCEGLILSEPRGSQGFGFDPLFIKHDYDRSFGELDDTTRLRVSHRGKAFEKLLPALERTALCTT